MQYQYSMVSSSVFQAEGDSSNFLYCFIEYSNALRTVVKISVTDGRDINKLYELTPYICTARGHLSHSQKI